MNSNEVHKLLDRYGVVPYSEINVLSQPSAYCKAGRWFIPDAHYMNILEKVNSVLATTPNKKMHLLEMPNALYNMIKIDIDLRFLPTEEELQTRSNLKRRYDSNFIDAINICIAESLQELIEVSDSYNIYIQEKPSSRITNENTIKDGIHIIIPDIVLSNKALHILRSKIIENVEIINLIKNMGSITDIKDVIDKRIISCNAWYIYGCGKPADNGSFYTVTKIFKVLKKGEDFIIKDNTQKHKTTTLLEYIKLFSNFGKVPTTEDYLIDFADYEDCDIHSTQYSKENSSEINTLLRTYNQNPSNIRRVSSLKVEEIKPFINCLKPKRVDDYNDWKKIGLCLYNMDNRNFDVWRSWSSTSPKYDYNYCVKTWCSEYPKCGKYNVGLNTLKEMAKQDNLEQYNKIINSNKKHFLEMWIHIHTTETHIKNLSINTLSNYIKTYIKDYANFNIACANPGASPTWYKFDNHKWTEDKAANKIYMLMTDEIQLELTIIHEELKTKVSNIQKINDETGKHNKGGNTGGNAGGGNAGGGGDSDGDEDGNSLKLVDDREARSNIDEIRQKHFLDQLAKVNLNKCGAILEFLSTPQNKKKIIEDLSQKCYDEEFYTNLDENRDVFVCSNGVLDLLTGLFRDGETTDMMTISSKLYYPKNIDSQTSQDILYLIQVWLDKIFPEEEIQEYVLNTFAQKLSGKLFAEKFHIFTGSGANGKSQFFKLINKVFGDYFKTFDNTLLNTAKRDANAASPAVASLKGCRIAVTTEPKGGQPFESDKVKELISGDTLVGRHLNKDPINFSPQYSMFMQCNDIPRNESTDDGFWRKIFIVPCVAKFISKDEDMYKLKDSVKFPFHCKAENQEHLYNEWAPFLLHMLFERYICLKENDFIFTVPDKVKIAVKEYMDEASTFTQFFNEKIIEAPGYKLDGNSLYSEFQLFVGRDFKTNKPIFLKQMERYIGKPKGKNKVYINFKLYGTSGEPIEESNDEQNNGEND